MDVHEQLHQQDQKILSTTGSSLIIALLVSNLNTQFMMFGLIGFYNIISGQTKNSGTIIDIKLVSCDLTANGTLYHAFSGAIIGYIYQKANIQINNTMLAQHNITAISDLLATLAGCYVGESAQEASIIIQNSNTNQCQLSSISNTTWNAYIGGVISKIFSYSQIINIQMVNISLFAQSKILTTQINLNAQSYQASFVAGILGQSLKNDLKIDNCNLNNINITVQGYRTEKSLYIYYQTGEYQINNVTASGTIVINNVYITYCNFTYKLRKWMLKWFFVQHFGLQYFYTVTEYITIQQPNYLQLIVVLQQYYQIREYKHQCLLFQILFGLPSNMYQYLHFICQVQDEEISFINLKDEVACPNNSMALQYAESCDLNFISQLNTYLVVNSFEKSLQSQDFQFSD
ncbi:Hypothetical_protein [Hexamita inflata]|uniref:Hypothetical_protein n=1 Tax=Hexamita inflata TaxID=28002 RepID=A0AA86QN15_9EUKA|nr:Hypothetical protein HINF_LOCUS44572 [Hexamita inflata]